jgi:hypothetical protein
MEHLMHVQDVNRHVLHKVSTAAHFSKICQSRVCYCQLASCWRERLMATAMQLVDARQSARTSTWAL